LAKQLKPSAELVGADVMPGFLPKENPSDNIRYVLQDVCEPFVSELVGHFDFTNIRFVLSGAARSGLRTAVANLASSLVPGGWLQIMELDTVEGQFTPAMQDLFFVMRTLFTKIGMSENWAPGLGGVFKDVGLENVEVKKVELLVGKKLGSEDDSLNSIEPFKITIPSLVTTCASTSRLLKPQ
jgi:pseurotin biosynthesis methyltransferase